MAKPFYETATRTMERRAHGKLVEYLEARFAEEKRKNPLCIGGSYTRGKGITFRYAAPEKKVNHDLEMLKTKWLKLWWTKNGATQEKKTAQDLEWGKTKIWLRKYGIY
jgi:hypothetical protein